MIAVGMGNNGAPNWTPRIDIKIASRTVESTISELNE
jgi:hypothetical protein